MELKNRIYNMDCMIGMAEVPDKSIDMILCDLPYGVTANKWDTVIPLDDLWVEYNRIIKDNGAIVLTAQPPFDKILGVSNLKMLKYEWIWEKSQPTGFLLAKKMPLRNHENILIFYKKPPTYNPQMESGKPYKTKQGSGSKNYRNKEKGIITENNGERYPKTVIKFARDKERYHPTQKPVSLFEYLIRTYTNEGEIVMDNCLGSGTTAIACIRSGRNFLGFEKEEEYFQIAKKRIDEEMSR